MKNRNFKRIICACLCLLLLFSFASCSKRGGDPSSAIKITATSGDGDIKDTVKITIPLSFVDEEYHNNLDLYCEKYGYISAKLNEKDETVTIKMNALSHDLLLAQIGMKVIKSIYNIVESGDYPYVKSIDSYDSKNFSEVVVSVDKEKYEADKTSSLMPFALAQCCFVYQAYTESTDYKCTVTVADAKTKDIISTKTYTDKDA